ncbi:ankyrin repeat and LEM domain-containing protein 1 [Phoenicopterus ruber ruber]
MSGAWRREPPARELTPLHVAASRGCCRCLEVLLKEGGDPRRRDQDGKRAIDLALGNRACVQILRDSRGARGWPPTEDLGGPRPSLSFLTEDGTEGSVSFGLPEDGSGAGPLSSTRRSQLEEPDLGGGCEPPRSLAGLAAGAATPQGPASPRHRHVTPRTKSRLQASAARLSASSSSSLFDEMLEMPRRPPRDPSPLGTRQPPWPHGSFSCLLAPRLPGSTAAELGSPAVPLSPPGCSTHCSEEHLEDEERGRAPTERHSPGTEDTASPEDAAVQDRPACTASPRPLSNEALRWRLRALGDDPGPVTELTRRLYLRRLEELAGGRRGGESPPARPAGPRGAGVGLTVLPDAGTAAPGHSPELAAALQSGRVPDCTQDELALARQFDRPDRSRRWREGLLKSSFNYLLLDPRTTQNLPLRSHRLSAAECFRTFVKAIFYVGKGTRARPYCHLAEALSQHRAGTQKGCPKVRRILEIWASGQGVVSVHCFQSTVPAEAYTREGCLVEALGLQTITNQRKGNCYGVAASWPAERRRRLGVHMLHRAMRIFLAEGERQLRPADIQGGR